MKRQLYILFALFLAGCGSTPVEKAKHQLQPAVETPVCEQGATADCIRRAQVFFKKKDFHSAERFFNLACQRKEPSGCVGLAEISLQNKGAIYRKRALVYLKKACQENFYEACLQIGSDKRLDIAPLNREKNLYRACNGGIAQACGLLGERKEKYRGRIYEAARYYSMACEGGLSEYCNKRKFKRGKVPPPKRRTREVFLKSFAADKRAGTQFRVSAGPCRDDGCPFHLYLKGPRGVIEKRRLPWSSTAGPVEKASGSSVAAGYEDHYVGTFVKRVRMGPHLDGIEVFQEKGYHEVLHRSDIYIHVGNRIVQIPWTENGIRSKEPAPDLLGVVIGLFDSRGQAQKLHRNLGGTACAKDMAVLSTNFFPKQKAGKWLVGSLKLGKDRAFATLERLSECYANVEAEVHRLF